MEIALDPDDPEQGEVADRQRFRADIAGREHPHQAVLALAFSCLAQEVAVQGEGAGTIGQGRDIEHHHGVANPLARLPPRAIDPGVVHAQPDSVAGDVPELVEHGIGTGERPGLFHRIVGRDGPDPADRQARIGPAHHHLHRSHGGGVEALEALDTGPGNVAGHLETA